MPDGRVIFKNGDIGHDSMDIVSRYQEPSLQCKVDEKELDEIAWDEAFKTHPLHSETDSIIIHRDGFVEGFKAGYRNKEGIIMEEVHLLVSILNIIVELCGYSVDTNGFRYDFDTLEIFCANEDSFKKRLEFLFNELCAKSKNLDGSIIVQIKKLMEQLNSTDNDMNIYNFYKELISLTN